jgi:hypothetical protein
LAFISCLVLPVVRSKKIINGLLEKIGWKKAELFRVEVWKLLELQQWFKKNKRSIGKNGDGGGEEDQKRIISGWFSWRIWLRNAWVILCWSLSPSNESKKKNSRWISKIENCGTEEDQKRILLVFFFCELEDFLWVLQAL